MQLPLKLVKEGGRPQAGDGCSELSVAEHLLEKSRSVIYIAQPAALFTVRQAKRAESFVRCQWPGWVAKLQFVAIQQKLMLYLGGLWIDAIFSRRGWSRHPV